MSWICRSKEIRSLVTLFVVGLGMLVWNSTARAQLNITGPSVVQGSPGASASFVLGIFNNSDSSFTMKSYSVKITLPNTTTASYTTAVLPTSNYVFASASTTGFTLLESTSTAITATDSLTTGSVTIGPGESRNLFQVNFIFAPAATQPVDVGFDPDLTQFVDAGNILRGFISPNIQLNPVPEPAGILALAVVGGLGFRIFTRRGQRNSPAASASACQVCADA